VRQISGIPLGPVLWLVTMLVMLGGFWYIVYRINNLSYRLSRITGLLISNGWDLETGKKDGGEVPKVQPADPDDMSGKHGIL
jgi:hypothetical protein